MKAELLSSRHSRSAALESMSTWISMSLVAASDGSWLASGGADGTVRLWDADTGSERATRVALTCDGWATILPDLRYKLRGVPSGEFWYAVGPCRFEPGELDPCLPVVRRLAVDAPLTTPATDTCPSVRT